MSTVTVNRQVSNRIRSAIRSGSELGAQVRSSDGKFSGSLRFFPTALENNIVSFTTKRSRRVRTISLSALNVKSVRTV